MLTPRQQAVLNVIVDYLHWLGYPPTIREIGERLNIKSPNGVVRHLSALERKGFIVRNRNVSRGIRLVEQEVE